MAAETAQTLDRGLRVLYLLAAAPDGLSVSELAKELGVGRTIVYRLTVTLESSALVRRGSDGRYRLGLGVLAIARHVQPMLRDAAMPALRALAEELSCTACLSVADSADALTVAVVEPASADVYLTCRVGQRSPLDRSAAGRAILLERSARARAPATRAFVAFPVAPGSQVNAVAAAVVGVPGIDAAVSVLPLASVCQEEAGAAVLRAAADVAIGLR